MIRPPIVDLDALRAPDRRGLARAITLLESTRAQHRAAAEALLHQIMPHSGGAVRLGISGAPGVGKSTFIEAMGERFTAHGHQVAVLTVDPTSARGGGSILADKTRMARLAADPRAFIRPSPSGQTLGGVARRTRESILLCEAAGFDMVIVETVGVGQSETTVAAMTDIFLLLLPPAGGDELQGIKRGVMELADMIVVNKSDGSLAAHAATAATQARRALSLMHRPEARWRVPVLAVSSMERRGLALVEQTLHGYYDMLTANGTLAERRREQGQAWLWSEAREQLLSEWKNHPRVKGMLNQALQRVGDGELPAAVAARELVTAFMEASS